MQRRYVPILVAILMVPCAVAKVAAHCEIPCGIYDDEMRVTMIAEHISTIEKAMKQLTELEDQKHTNYNQLTRWIMNKEHHADKFWALALARDGILQESGTTTEYGEMPM